MNKLEAFEMWVYRRILKSVNRDGELLITDKTRKTAYLDHLLRNQKYYIPQLIIERIIERKRGLGREKLSWLHDIRYWTELGFEELIRTTEDRDEYAIVIAKFH